MNDREIALILLNMQADMDYADTADCGKETADKLEEEIAILRLNNSYLFCVLENIAMQNEDSTILIDGTEA